MGNLQKHVCLVFSLNANVLEINMQLGTLIRICNFGSQNITTQRPSHGVYDSLDNINSDSCKNTLNTTKYVNRIGQS